MIRYRTTWGILCQFVMCFLIIIASCKERAELGTDLSDFYLPLDSLDGEGSRYIYKNLIDSNREPEIWQHIKTSEGQITSINYDHVQQVVQKQYERVVETGVLVDSLVLFFYDSTGIATSIPVKVHSANRFPFGVPDSTVVWLSHFEWWQPGDSLHVILERRRSFDGDTIWNWGGKEVPAVKFHTSDKFETEQVGWTTSGWEGQEIYAKGIGLVYYRRDISPQLRLAFQLEKITR